MVEVRARAPGGGVVVAAALGLAADRLVVRLPLDREALVTALKSASTTELMAELSARGALPRCKCGRWNTYMGAYDDAGYTLRCHGCLRAVARCTCG